MGKGSKIRTSDKIFFLFLYENICCDPSLEPSRRDGSNAWEPLSLPRGTDL